MNWFWWKKKKKKLHDDNYPGSVPYSGSKGGRRKFIPAKPPEKYYLPFSVLKSTNDVFKIYGNRRAEAYAWWAGYIVNGDMAQICTVLYPNIKTRYGHIHLDRQVLGFMHRRLIDLDQILLVELHTHPPGAGGQNDVDAANSTLFYKGFKAVVVPDFGLPKFYDLRRCYVYSYIGNSHWYEMDVNEISHCFVIDETCSEVKPQ
jgi:hypothetical protein